MTNRFPTPGAAQRLSRRSERPVPVATPGEVFQFHISPVGILPEIWRRIEVPSTYSFWDLHVAIQDAFGWEDCHLHEFRVVNPATGQRERIGIAGQEWGVDDPLILPGWFQRLSDYVSVSNPLARYTYDFGDQWEHTVRLELLLPRRAGQRYPRCLASVRACPPEDCGGPPGYEELLAAIADPAHADHDRLLNWVGGRFDPEGFDPRRVKFDHPGRRIASLVLLKSP